MSLSGELTWDELQAITELRPLNDHHIHLAQEMLKTQFPDIKGLHSTLLSDSKSGFPSQPDRNVKTMQIHHIKDSHWVLSCTKPLNNDIFIYDSNIVFDNDDKVILHPDLEVQIAQIYNSMEMLKVVVPEIQQQTTAVDCGLFAIAWAVELSLGNNVEAARFVPSKLRSHFLKCLERGRLSSFPKRKTTKVSKRHAYFIPLVSECFDYNMHRCSTCKNCFHALCCSKTKSSCKCVGCRTNK